MRIDVLTLFPEFIQAGIGFSIVKRAQEIGALQINTCNPRDFTKDRHRTVDDTPYGGGAGMVMKCDIIFASAEHCLEEAKVDKPRVILFEPQGKLLNQALVQELAQEKYLMLICGRYEGADARIADHLATDVVSIGDYVLTGGELPALIMIDGVARLLPNVLGSEDSLEQDSFADGALGYPQYTRPESFREWRVPDVLLSGNHAEIAKWRRKQSLLTTKKIRPDLFEKIELSKQDKALLDEQNDA